MLRRKKTSTMTQRLLGGGGRRGAETKEESPSWWEDTDEPSDSQPITCMALLKHSCTHPAEKLSETYGQWREEQRERAWRMERKLASRQALDTLIDAQLARFHAHYSGAMRPSRPRDVPAILQPPWKPPMENAALSWLGDWRPSTILSLIPTISSFSPSSFLELSPRAQRTLTEAIRRLRAREAVLDEEVAEFQANGVLNLPFSRPRGAMEAVAEEMRKMERVLARAQRLRCRALEVAVHGGVLDRAQAAQFLVAFAGVQDVAHRCATRWKARAGPLCITIHDLVPAR